MNIGPQQFKNIYQGILNLDESGLTSTLKNVTDGDGNVTPLQLSTTKIGIYGGSNRVVEFNVITGDWIGYGSSQMSPYNFSTGNFEIQADSNFNIDFRIGTNTKMFLTNSGNLGIGTLTISARLQVRGDGTNPIARFENSVGTRGYTISANGLIFGPIGTGGQESIVAGYSGGLNLDGSVLTINAQTYESQSNVTATMTASYGGGWRMLHGNYTFTSGNLKTLHVSGGIAAAAGSANYRPFQIDYTINNSGAQSGTATGIYLRATETALNSMAHNFIDLGTIALGSLFSVTNKGAIKVASLANADAPNSSLYFSTDASRLVWKDAGGTVNNLY